MAEEYDVCEEDTLRELVAVVNARLADGWVLAGGVQVFHFPWDDGVAWLYVQAMLRRSP